MVELLKDVMKSHIHCVVHRPVGPVYKLQGVQQGVSDNQSQVFMSTEVIPTGCYQHNSMSQNGKHALQDDLIQTDLDLRYFWSWSAFEDYLLFCFGFTMLCAFVTLLFLDWVVFVEALGSLALMSEAMLGLPQLMQNYTNRSTRGMRELNPLSSLYMMTAVSKNAVTKSLKFCVKMVLLWTAGDIFKTSYFVINESPMQFWVCGGVQILIDVIILLQVGFYNQDSRVKLG
ncbi:hypothetical protein NFI96_001677 [Prochilodus magdalenae]|nr:hypothetical protein NFI96_001677 [Prochilodus magdalenae]